MWRILTALAASLAIVSYAKAAFGFDLSGQPAFWCGAYETVRNIALFFFPADAFFDLEDARWTWLGLNESSQFKDGVAFLAMMGGSYLKPIGDGKEGRERLFSLFKDTTFLRATATFVGISAVSAIALIVWGTQAPVPATP